MTVIFLPKRANSRLQPLDSGVIAIMKRRSRRRQHEYSLYIMEGDDTNNLYQINDRSAFEWMYEIRNEIDLTKIHDFLC